MTNQLYIGEGDPVLPRLKRHSVNKDFWTESIVFTSKDDYLTKTQIQYLESVLIEQAKDAFKAKIDNTNSPAKPNISEVDKSEVEQFIEGIELILSSLGYDFLVPRTLNNDLVEAKKSSQVFELKTKDVIARMLIIDNSYVVLSGSTAVLENRTSIPGSIQKLRKDLIDSGIMLNEGNGVYTFKQDTSFNSPSYAAAAIIGAAANGRKIWKYGNKSLKQIDNEQNGKIDYEV
ncbi:GIY-YIG nuclease family protein [Paenibacillus periandrae]|uniref:GIY-YIG nuclease family protein n=1 Tax=Paenibacillus periandrae TaxID=1761741 RepID=UPI001F08BAF2|nr:GIY-YIG nuclease family protein [Paenibacillus periandrae]